MANRPKVHNNPTDSSIVHNSNIVICFRLLVNFEVEPITKTSVILEPQGKAEACGVQDPRIVFDERSATYYMTYAAYANPLPKDPKTNPYGIYCGDAWVGLASTKTPEVARMCVGLG